MEAYSLQKDENLLNDEMGKDSKVTTEIFDYLQTWSEDSGESRAPFGRNS